VGAAVWCSQGGFLTRPRAEQGENKSGAHDFGQLETDQLALERGWTVTWNINRLYPYSPEDLAELERLKAKWPGQFFVNRI
jgi:hypothetical protein